MAQRRAASGMFKALCSGWLAVALCTLSPLSALAQKTDIIRMDNGNVFIGEVKRLRKGLLEVTIDDVTNRLSIEWLHVVGVTTQQSHDIALNDGTHYFGVLREANEPGQLRIQTADGVVDVDLLDVVFIEPIRESFWKRVDGSLSTGLSASKSTNLVLLNLGVEARHRTVRTLTNVKLNSFSTLEPGGQLKTNSDFQLNHLGIRARRWLTRSTIAAGRNDELGINLRGGVGYGGGRAVVLSNRTNLWLSGLLSGNREYTNDGRQKNNLELVFDTNLLAFRYDNPRLELKADLSTFANLTTAGRYRVNFDGRISLELLKDFFWDVGQVYYRYDNEPSTEAESTSDYGIVTGVRYKF